MKRVARGLIALVASLLVVTAAAFTLPPLVLRDAPAPTAVAALVDDARQSVIGNSRVFPRPLHPRLTEARCFEEGRVAFSFEEWVPPYRDLRYAVAVGELDPPFGVHGWEGGYHLGSIRPGSTFEQEWGPLLGSEIPCE